jgi:hypothetical protein
MALQPASLTEPPRRAAGVVDDDQEVWSVLARVGVLSDTSLSGFLVGP